MLFSLLICCCWHNTADNGHVTPPPYAMLMPYAIIDAICPVHAALYAFAMLPRMKAAGAQSALMRHAAYAAIATPPLMLMLIRPRRRVSIRHFRLFRLRRRRHAAAAYYAYAIRLAPLRMPLMPRCFRRRFDCPPRSPYTSLILQDMRHTIHMASVAMLLCYMLRALPYGGLRAMMPPRRRFYAFFRQRCCCHTATSLSFLRCHYLTTLSP